MKKLLLTLICITLFSMTMISALDFDNIKSIKDNGKYPDIQIKNAFGLGSTIWSGELTKNSDSCSINCEAEQTITLGKKGVLIQDLKFYDYYTNEEVKINYKIFANGKEYKLGTELEEGNYNVKLEGNKHPLQVIDWIYKTNGITLDEWALWGSKGVLQYYDLNDTTEIVSGVYNLTFRDGTPSFVNLGCLIGGCGSVTVNNNLVVDGSNATNFNDGPHTINYWFNSTDGTDVVLSDMEAKLQVALAANGTTLSVSNVGFSIPIHSTIGVWTMLTLVRNATNTGIYINGTLKQVKGLDGNDTSGIFCLGAKCNTVATDDFVGLIDEVGFWNQSLTDAEITSLYNTGIGLGYFGSAITLNYPVNNNITLNQNVTFNCSFDSPQGISNLSLWTNSTGTWQINQTIELSGTMNSTEFIVYNLPNNYILWTCSGYNQDNNNNFFANTNRTLQVTSYIESNLTYNTSTYETKSEKFSINITKREGLSLTNPKLIYEGTSYTTSSITNGDEIELYKTIDIPTGVNTNSFYFNFTIDKEYSTSNTTQSSVITNFILCNATYPTKFLNITFKDESDNSQINATIPTSTFNYYLGSGSVNKTYSLINNTENFEYDFCATPNQTLNVIPYVQYAKESYPQRIWNPTIQSYSNVTTNQILYLLSSTDGIYTTFQVLNPNDQAVSGVTVTATRIIGESTIQIGVGETSSSGTVTFWVNPDFLTTFTFEKSGFETVTYSDFPTQASYTITFGSIDEPAEDYTRGIVTYINPKQSELFNNTEYVFSFNVTSSYWDLDSFGFNLRLANGSIVGSDSSTTSGSPAEFSYNVNNQSIIYMDYYWIINGTELTGTRYWIITNTELTGWSIKTFFTDLTLYLDSGMFGLDDFGRILIVFMILFISTGIVSYKFGLTSPMSVASMIFAIVFFFDIVVGLIPEIRGIDHLLTYLAGIVLVGLIIKEVSV